MEVKFGLQSATSTGSEPLEPLSAWVQCDVEPPGVVRLTLLEGAGGRLRGPGNDAERAIAATLVSAIRTLAGEDVDDSYDSVFEALPAGLTKMLHVLDADDDLLLRFGPTRRPRLVQGPDVERVLDEIGAIARADLGLPEGPIAADHSTGVLNEIVERLFRRISSLLGDLEPAGLLEELLSQQEAILYSDAKSRLVLPSQAACFGEESAPVREALRSDRDATTTAICSRFLIELVTAMPPQGSRIFSLGLYDEAIALAKHIVEFGMLSDALRHQLSSASLAVLPSGRLGVSREEPYHETLAAYVALLSDRYLPSARSSYARHWRSPTEDDHEPFHPDELNEAFVAEFGVTAGELAELSGELMNIAEKAPAQIAAREREELVSEIAPRLNWSRDRVRAALDVFSLSPLESFPPRTKPADVYPWRFSRDRSMARRPVLLRPAGGDTVEVVFAPRTVLRSGHYLLEQLNAGRFEPHSEGMRFYMTKVRQQANEAFNHEVAELFRSVDGVTVLENIDKFGKLRLARENGEAIGDIDVLAMSPTTKVLLVAEVKDFELARTPAELANEVDKLLVGEKSAARHHEERVAFVEAHLPEILEHLRLAGHPAAWRIRDVIITSDDLMAAHLPAVDATRGRPAIVCFDEITASGPESLLTAAPRTSSSRSGKRRSRRRR